MKDEDKILSEYISNTYIDSVKSDEKFKKLVKNTLSFKLYLLKIRMKEFIKSL